MIPVHVVTGFLGSGKTTLLREVLARPAFADSAVIVNELGEIGLDHLLLEEVDEGVLLMASGCLCCTVRSDVEETLRALHDRAARGAIPRFARVVVETTGIADPAPIAATLIAAPTLRHHFRLGTIVCTVDAVAGAATLDRHPEATKQAAVADRLVVTKCDLAAEAAVAALEARLRALNPAAAMARGRGAGFDAEALFGDALGDPARRAGEVAGWLRGAAPGAPHHHPGDAHDGVHAFTITYAAPIDWTAFGIWLTALLHAHGARVLRVKGLLEVQESDAPVVLHGVQHVVHPPLHLARWPAGVRGSRLVFITRGLAEAPVRESLDAFLAMAAQVAGAAGADA